MKDKYICPVCGFDGLSEPPYDKQNQPSYEVCPCCGFEFGFDEQQTSDKYNVFRSTWIKNGAEWFLPNKKPKDWNLKKQLENLKV
jgi:transcription elongation factor Elf1